MTRLGTGHVRVLLGRGGTHIALLVFCVFVFVPVYWIAASSFTPSQELLRRPPQWVPSRLTFDSYALLARSLPFRSYVTNSLVFAVGSTLLSLSASVLAAYAFARLRFPGRQLVFVVLMLSVTLPPVATVIPLFQMYANLGLVDTRAGLVILMGSLLTPFTIWVLASFIRQLPYEVEEAARIDGAGTLTLLWRIMAPMAAPALASLFVINFVITWNELFFPLVFSSTEASKPLTLGLVELTRGGAGAGRPWDLMSALSMVMVVPAVLLVVATQRLIIEGLTQGSSK